MRMGVWAYGRVGEAANGRVGAGMLTAVLILGAGPGFHEVIGGNVVQCPRVGRMPWVR
jgi:hypothetical protein